MRTWGYRAKCPLMAQSGHSLVHCKCPLSGVKRTSLPHRKMSAYDPKRTCEGPASGPSRALGSNFMLPQHLLLSAQCVDSPAYGVTSCRELIAVAVAQIDRDPIVCDRLIHPALEIAVANVKKIIALKRATHNYPMTHKNAEYLAADFFVRGAVRHRAPMFDKRVQITISNRACCTAASIAFRKLSPCLSQRGKKRSMLGRAGKV
jgi:hypothetical protein